MKYDFSGRAASTNVRCTDGTMFHSGAFKSNNGKIVPLVWMHQHDSPENTLGRAFLENTDEGLKVYGSFNDTENGKLAKQLVEHGDITSLSVWANHLNREGNELYNGDVKEVSLVLAGADPTARIEQTAVIHSDVDTDGNEIIEGIIYSGEPIEMKSGEIIEHADTQAEEPAEQKKEPTAQKKTYREIFNSLTDEQKNLVYALLKRQEQELKAVLKTIPKMILTTKPNIPTKEKLK